MNIELGIRCDLGKKSDRRRFAEPNFFKTYEADFWLNLQKYLAFFGPVSQKCIY